MTSEQKVSDREIDVMSANLAKLEALQERMAKALAKRKPIRTDLQGPGQDLFLKAAAAWMSETMNNPTRMVEHQVGWWGKTLSHYAEAQKRLARGDMTPPPDETPTDRRFSNPLWETHPFFNFIKQQYMMNSEAMVNVVADTEAMDEKDRKRLDYFTRQIVDMMAPTNFLATNPDALEQALKTEGQSLVDGLENFVRDLEANDGEVVVSLADKSAFTVGENLATTQGSVVYRNAYFELIQYAPTTPKVHRTPMLIFPPWINKYYILDMTERNSLVKWVVDQGYTLFVVSWINPDASFKDVTLENYVEHGFLEAIDQVKTITGEQKINVTGYCIAGTTLSLTLAHLKRIGDKSVKSATFFTTLTDFSDTGEVGVFLDEDFLGGLEAEAAQNGVMKSLFMSRTFSYLRSRDLIYTPAIRTYMMGEAPPAFDLLYWNSDGTNLPGKLAVEYLRGLCQRNEFVTSGYRLFGAPVNIKDVDVPLCAVACETDHIATWRASYSGVRKMGSKNKTFILSQSGHIAGIINPPSKKKYGHYTNPDLTLASEDWRAGADFNEGSWWPRWESWLAAKSGAMVKARTPGDSTHPVICAAPGTYVTANPKL
ncbi:Poly-beta-hydroxybutyrate polymerase [Aquimixticola soesokkakensis]|uniref:Poly-beta-hydroxybutyrate polymerase n=1 Tax=Aquimixticola soesokkakensis TaxID=1519096 RepID=A0A1Y5SWL6_9RHOB|nr:class I poly(R)-hydroxyalkanoic acid synthase [Aquimixticola soesokkakensis]SLN50181.1 Poly-beta-hydroxybutyrate polymerase [Aquimixticola soesokkakensis]